MCDLPKYRTVGINPQWNVVFTTPKTTPKRSLASGDSPIFYIFYLNIWLENQISFRWPTKGIELVTDRLIWIHSKCVSCARTHTYKRRTFHSCVDRCDIRHKCMQIFDEKNSTHTNAIRTISQMDENLRLNNNHAQLYSIGHISFFQSEKFMSPKEETKKNWALPSNELSRNVSV